MKDRSLDGAPPRAQRTLALDAEMLADPRWDALTRGDIGDADRVELDRLAAEDPLACEVTETEREVRIRIEPADLPVRVTWGDLVLSPRTMWPDGGQLLTVEVPSGGETGTLVVIAGAGTAQANATLRLEVRRAASDSGLDRARALRREGRVADAIASLPDPSALPELLRGRALSLRARLDLASGRAAPAILGTAGASWDRAVPRSPTGRDRTARAPRARGTARPRRRASASSSWGSRWGSPRAGRDRSSVFPGTCPRWSPRSASLRRTPRRLPAASRHRIRMIRRSRGALQSDSARSIS